MVFASGSLLPDYSELIITPKNDFRRQKTKGALVLEVVIKQSLFRNEDGLITDSAIEEGEQRFGSIDADGLICFQPQYNYSPISNLASLLIKIIDRLTC